MDFLVILQVRTRGQVACPRPEPKQVLNLTLIEGKFILIPVTCLGRGSSQLDLNLQKGLWTPPPTPAVGFG